MLCVRLVVELMCAAIGVMVFFCVFLCLGLFWRVGMSLCTDDWMCVCV